MSENMHPGTDKWKIGKIDGKSVVRKVKKNETKPI